jgi:hypothetical protein
MGEALARGLSIEIGNVRLGVFQVWLDDVTVSPIGVPGVQGAFSTVEVHVRPNLSVDDVDVDGGNVDLSGSLEELRVRLTGWRQQGSSPTSSGRPRVALRGRGIGVTWAPTAAGPPSCVARGLRFSRDENGTRVGSDAANLSFSDVGLTVQGAEVYLGNDGALQRANVGTVAVSLELPSSPTSVDPSAAQMAAEPPPLPPSLKAGGKQKGPVPTEPQPPLLHLPELHLWRAAAANLGAALAARLPEGGSVEVGGLSISLRKGGEALSLGPGPLTARRASDRVDVDFSTGPATTGTPLTIRAEIPIDAQDVSLSLAGGPVSLSLLGIQEGAAGLTDVDRTTVAGKGRVILEAHGESLTFDGALTVRGLAIRQPRLADGTLRGLDFGVSARGVLSDKGELRLDDADGSLGAFRLSLHGGLEQATDHLAASIQFEVPTTSCQALLDSAPTALLPALGGATMVGTLGGTGRLAFDTRRLDDLVLDYQIDDRCRMAHVPEDLEKERFTKEFSHRIYLKDGSLAEESTGPGTPNWTDLDHISPYMQVAVLTTEDGAFYHHHGFNHAAIRGALIANLKARRFVRGASTITMQLAKNLFLSRDKTLGRKLEELILTDYLEQVFTKDEMMELYLNIIEFGPDLYGVTAAAEHYFGRKPEELHLAESLFLSSILPSPIRFHGLWEKGGLSESWMRGIHDRMEIANRTGKINQAELADGLSEPVVFWHPDMPRPTPRQPLVTDRRLEEDGAGEQTN